MGRIRSADRHVESRSLYSLALPRFPGYGDLDSLLPHTGYRLHSFFSSAPFRYR